MTTEELTKLCNFYHGEQCCPKNFDRTPYGQLWQAEKMLCEDILCDNPNIQMDNPRKIFDEYIALYVGKWNPYGFEGVMNLYFEKVHVITKK
ncbi:MAG: hypothetical protein IJ838_00375 [Paludibacteraceae bacterium]|nr:hypothetical protein [Paludibacteraceae bacterium]